MPIAARDGVGVGLIDCTLRDIGFHLESSYIQWCCLSMHMQECQNSCCNATTCMPADGADCAVGQCCENC